MEMGSGKFQVSGILPGTSITLQLGSCWGSLGSWALLRNPNSAPSPMKRNTRTANSWTGHSSTLAEAHETHGRDKPPVQPIRGTHPSTQGPGSRLCPRRPYVDEASLPPLHWELKACLCLTGWLCHQIHKVAKDGQKLQQQNKKRNNNNNKKPPGISLIFSLLRGRE